MSWNHAPSLYYRQSAPEGSLDYCATWTSIDGCQCFETSNYGSVQFKRVIGQSIGFALYVRDHVYDQRLESMPSKISITWASQQDPAVMLECLSARAMNKANLINLLDPEGEENEGKTAIINLQSSRDSTNPQAYLRKSDNHLWQLFSIFGQSRIPIRFLRSLRALSFGHRVYIQMPAASISLRIVEQPLDLYTWIPEEIENSESGGPFSMAPSRSQAFACIATF